MKLILDRAPAELIAYIESNLPATLSGQVEILDVNDIDYSDTANGRWTQLVLAGKGARLWSNTKNEDSPIYAGLLPSTPQQADLLIADLNYTKQQVDFYAKQDVAYIGRVYVDARNMLIIDNKKASERHDNVLQKPLEALLSAAPKDWWGSLGIVSSGNVEKLEAFMSNFPDVVVLVYTTGGAAKAKFFGLEYVHLNEPKLLEDGSPDLKYGRNMRGMAASMSLQPTKVANTEISDNLND